MPLQVKSDRERSSYSRVDVTQVIDSIRAIVKALRDSGREAEQELGMTSAQLYVLQELRDKPASINELAARTYTHQSSVSIVVARLVERRLVTRTAARTDARKVLISLTTAGRAILRRTPDVAQTRLVNALRSMPKADLSDLAHQLTSLIGVMEEQEGQRPKLAQKRFSFTG